MCINISSVVQKGAVSVWKAAQAANTDLGLGRGEPELGFTRPCHCPSHRRSAFHYAVTQTPASEIMELCETGIHQIPSSLASVVTLVPVL